MIIGVAGLPGAGKTTVSRLLGEAGFRVYSMGDIVRRRAAELGMSTDEASVYLRITRGARAVVVDLINEMEEGNAVVEGLRSVDELDALRERFNSVFLIYVASSMGVRFSRLKNRGRPDDPRSPSDLIARDYRELKFGLAELISRADRIILNDDGLESLRESVRNIIQAIV
ncbi:hypothetical protein GCM10007981_02060 [Thermocladium modestius]|uniref:Dephospho-CoA kinase n=1 Tax=Thermocladium modestius TaxID=62609 RepID=A0A830GSL0_9CREN|nr:AAA family ATPase [Thermocladium modestius]GGP19227.1 hypothetical protein GCM10007981_02060 [Thermocladium modestius]